MPVKISLINPPVRDYSCLDIGLVSLSTHLNERTPHRANIVDLVTHRKDWRQHLEGEAKTA